MTNRLLGVLIVVVVLACYLSGRALKIATETRAVVLDHIEKEHGR